MKKKITILKSEFSRDGSGINLILSHANLRSTSEVPHRGMKFRQLAALSLRFLWPAARDTPSSLGEIAFLKPGLHISRKDRKHMFGNMYFLSYSNMVWSPYHCSDHKY